MLSGRSVTMPMRRRLSISDRLGEASVLLVETQSQKLRYKRWPSRQGQAGTGRDTVWQAGQCRLLAGVQFA